MCDTIPLPANLSPLHASVLGTAWLTAYRALFTRSGLRAGETALIQGATAGENEKTRNLPVPVVPARRQLYRPGSTSYLALPVLAANRLDRSDPQVPLNAAFTMRSDRFRLAGTTLAFGVAGKCRKKASEGGSETFR